MRSFVHGRVIFAGDAAHVVSPFGARGANSGIQDVDNLAWKLAWVVQRRAPARLLATYDAERAFAADVNILHSTRSTDFITPKSGVSRVFRDATLMLARRHAFARRLVNSGRLSVPAVLADSALNSEDTDRFDAGVAIGAVAVDAPVKGARGDWLLGYLGGDFTLLVFAGPIAQDALRELAARCPACDVLHVGASAAGATHDVDDVDGLVGRRYDGRPGTCYLFRPDQHVCARWRDFDLDRVKAAIDRAVGSSPPGRTEKAA
jgi:3-(3-hydroxy-phenyl)propionate hydroxylase